MAVEGSFSQLFVVVHGIAAVLIGVGALRSVADAFGSDGRGQSSEDDEEFHGGRRFLLGSSVNGVVWCGVVRRWLMRWNVFLNLYVSECLCLRLYTALDAAVRCGSWCCVDITTESISRRRSLILAPIRRVRHTWTRNL